MHVSGFYVFHFSMFFSFFEIPLSSQECSTTHLHKIATLTYYTICRKGCIFILSCVLQKHRTYFFKIKNEPVKAHFCEGKCNIIIKICRLAYIFQDIPRLLSYTAGISYRHIAVCQKYPHRFPPQHSLWNTATQAFQHRPLCHLM